MTVSIESFILIESIGKLLELAREVCRLVRQNQFIKFKSISIDQHWSTYTFNLKSLSIFPIATTEKKLHRNKRMKRHVRPFEQKILYKKH